MAQFCFVTTVTQTFQLYDADTTRVSSWVIQIDGMTTGTVVPKGRTRRKDGLTALTFIALAYRDMSTTSDTAGSTAISADGIYKVYADGMDVELVYTKTTGNPVITATALVG